MRLRNADYLLLKNVWAYVSAGGRDDLSAGLKEMLDRFEQTQVKTREANRRRAKQYYDANKQSQSGN